MGTLAAGGLAPQRLPYAVGGASLSGMGIGDGTEASRNPPRTNQSVLITATATGPTGV